MPQENLWVVSAAPRKLTINITHTPDVTEQPYLIELVSLPTKGQGGEQSALPWPEGAVEMLPSAAAQFVDSFIYATTMKEVSSSWRPQLIRARVYAHEMRF